MRSRASVGFRQFGALMRKNVTLKVRHWVQLFVELAVPVLFMVSLDAIKWQTDVIFVPEDIPSHRMPVAEMKHLVNHTQYPYVLCGDNNIFLSCGFPSSCKTSRMNNYYDYLYGIELAFGDSYWQNMHGDKIKYEGICTDLVTAAAEDPGGLAAAAAAVDLRALGVDAGGLLDGDVDLEDVLGAAADAAGGNGTDLGAVLGAAAEAAAANSTDPVAAALAAALRAANGTALGDALSAAAAANGTAADAGLLLEVALEAAGNGTALATTLGVALDALGANATAADAAALLLGGNVCAWVAAFAEFCGADNLEFALEAFGGGGSGGAAEARAQLEALLALAGCPGGLEGLLSGAGQDLDSVHSSTLAILQLVSTYDSPFDSYILREEGIGDACAPKALAVAPSSEDAPGAAAAAADFLEYLRNQWPELEAGGHLIAFSSEAALTKHVGQKGYSQRPDAGSLIGAAVVFHSSGIGKEGEEASSTALWDYAIRLNFTHEASSYRQGNIPDSGIKTDPFLRTWFWPPYGERGIDARPYQEMYLTSSFLALQRIVDEFIFLQEKQNETAQMPIASYHLGPFGYEGFETLMKHRGINANTRLCCQKCNPGFSSVGWVVLGEDSTKSIRSAFWEGVGFLFAFMIVLAMMYPVANIIKAIVQEKELKLKEGMLMMGMSPVAHTLSWWLAFALFFFILDILMVIASRPLFEHSDPGLIFFYFLFFFLAAISFSFLISAFFSRAKTAATIGVLFFFASIFPYFGLRDADNSVKAIACVLPATCLALGTDVFAVFEDASIGVTSFTAYQETNTTLAFTSILAMLLFDAVLYAGLAWYCAQVVPSAWGTARPPWFPLTRAYWRPRSAGRARLARSRDLLLGKEESLGNPNVEPVGDNLLRQLEAGNCLAIRELTKIFHKGRYNEKIAVNKLNLTLYQGQITALLGHNGAGKTTTISMLTGMIPITSGNAFLNGKDVCTEMAEIRRSLGVCPQHDILYPTLTVQEHLKMYASFKGVPRREVATAVEQMIKEVGLTEKRNTFSRNLSGGQRRKLSVAIAFIGGSKVVFLDEPTSGMDPYSRRFTWDVIRRNREGRIIVLTTHFMDEADLLGDRVAIVGEGRLRCCGSSLFLKSRFGAGYNLTLVKQFEREKEVESKEEASPAPEARIPPHNTSPATCNKDKEILDLVAHHVGGAKLLSNVGAEMSFQLPQESSKNFASLFFELDERLPDLGIGTYGVSVTTLEEVFLRVAEGKFDEEIQKTMRENSMSIASIDAANQDLWKMDDSWKKDRIKGMGLFLMNLTILFKKRFWNYKRDRKAWVFTFISPAVFIFAGLLVLQATSSWVKPSLKLEISALFNRNTRKEPTQPVLYTDSCFVQNGTLCSADIENLMFGISDIDAMQCDFSWFDADYKFAAVNSTSDSYEQDSSSILDFQNYLNARGSEEIYTMNSYLLDTKNDQDASRYGAVYFEDTSSSSTLVDYKITLLTNFTGLHAAPAFLNVVNEALIQKVLGDHEISITVRSFPLDLTQFELSQKQGIDGFTVTIFILFAFAFVPAGFAQYVVHEKEMKIKYQQVVSGVNLNAYWLSSWIWDSFQFLAGPMALCIAMLYIFDVEILVGNAVDATLTLFILFGLGVVPFTYICSFFFNSAPVAQNLSILMNWIFGLLLMCTTFIMSLIPSTQGDAVLLRRAFRVFPQYCFADALLRVSFRDFLYFFDSAVPRDPSPWHPEVAGLDIAWLGGEVLAYGLLLLAAERAAAGSSPLARRVAAARLRAGRYQPTRVDPSEVDPDVQEEQARVEAGGPHADVIRVHGLRKAFPLRGGFKEAVRGLTLGVPRGECFGLLGINGAGKSTTMSILTGEQPPTSGRGELAGMDVTADAERVHQLVGYCPQFDAIFPLLTGRENLRIYGRIKGIPARLLEPLVERTIRQLRLDAYADRLAAGYSGGNKRKLSVGVAIIGAPELIFLDEPSTGMDPVVRRYLWDVVAKISTEWAQCAMVLTTHSMEEAEALCTRIGIMVGGRLRCLGSGQHLKSRFGLGFQLEFGLELPTEDEVHKIFSASSVLSAKEVVPESDLWATLKSLLGIEEETVKQDWLGKFSASGSASALHHEQVAHGHIQAQSLVSWLLLEQRCIAAHSFVERFFEHSVLRERQGPKFRFEYPVQDKPLGRMFAILEENKASLKIKEYSLSQTSLEQIFNHFANQQEEEKGKVAGLVQHHPEENGVLSGGTSSSQQLHASSSKHTSVVAPS